VSRRLTPIRPPVVNRQRRPVTPARSCGVRFERVVLLRLRLGFLLLAAGLEPAPNTYRGSCSERSRCSASQKLVGSLTRPFKCELAPDPRILGLPVQLAPGSREGQSSNEERPSAPREWVEGGWASNQGEWMPGTVHEAIACSVAEATGQRSCDLLQTSSSGSALGVSRHLAPVRRLDPPPPLPSTDCVRGSDPSRTPGRFAA
jgi:hypothetical protein